MNQASLSLTVAFLMLCVGCSNEETPTHPGEQVVTSTCNACHLNAINGAPIIGNEAMWNKRLHKGLPTLIEHAINGFELMPAKGGNKTLTDEQVEQAVRYMVAQVSEVQP